jgi:hypothetical protein
LAPANFCKVHQGDQIVLIHQKTGQFIHLGDKKFDDNSAEITLYNQQTGWHIHHYAPFVREGDNLVNGGNVVRIYHPEAEGFIQARETPLYKNKHNHGNLAVMFMFTF